MKGIKDFILGKYTLKPFNSDITEPEFQKMLDKAYKKQDIKRQKEIKDESNS